MDDARREAEDAAMARVDEDAAPLESAAVKLAQVGALGVDLL